MLIKGTIYNRIKHEVKENKECDDDEKVNLIDGMLYLPELGLFIPKDSNAIDCHGFGEMKNLKLPNGTPIDDYPGLLHLVPSEKCVAWAAHRALYPRPFDKTDPWKSRICVSLPVFDVFGNMTDDEVCM